MPDFVALVLVFWCMRQPRLVGLGAAWALGLITDAGNGVLLGQHALAYSILAFLGIWLSRRILWFGFGAAGAARRRDAARRAGRGAAGAGGRGGQLPGLGAVRRTAVRRAAVADRELAAADAAAPGRAGDKPYDGYRGAAQLRARAAAVPAAHRRRGHRDADRLRHPGRALLLPAGGPARALPLQGRGQPHLDRADPAEPRPDHRPQRRGRGAQLFRLHAGDLPAPGEERGGDDRRARRADRDHAARPRALQAAHGRDAQPGEPADPHAPHRRGGRQVRRQPLPL